jgi:hypothetical protein
VAFVVTILCCNFWTNEAWWEQVISVLPNLLGFTLGGFAIFLGFGSETFKTMLSDDDETKSPYISVSASFLIFVLFQVVALLYAFVSKAMHFDLVVLAHKKEWFFEKQAVPIQEWLLWLDPFTAGFGYLLFVYSMIFTLRASMRIFRLSRWYHSLIVEEAEEAERERLRLSQIP